MGITEISRIVNTEIGGWCSRLKALLRHSGILVGAPLTTGMWAHREKQDAETCRREQNGPLSRRNSDVSQPMKPAHVITALLLLLLPAAGFPTADATDWEEVKNKDGIRIYTREVTDSPILIARGICVVEANAEAVLTVLDDNYSHPKWVPFLVESQRLETLSRTERLEYNRFDAPWPATDRDFVYRAKATADKDNRVIVFSMKSEPSPLKPEQEDKVRGTLLESTFTLTALSPTQTQVELRFHADPNGWIPAWITNLIQRAWPYYVLKGLRTEVQSQPSAPLNPTKTVINFPAKQRLKSQYKQTIR